MIEKVDNNFQLSRNIPGINSDKWLFDRVSGFERTKYLSKFNKRQLLD